MSTTQELLAAKVEIARLSAELDNARKNALRDAARPMNIIRWSEGSTYTKLSVAAVNRYLVDFANGEV